MVAPEHYCGICRDLLIEPITLLCQHTFCRLCLEAFVEKNPAGCPCCRKPFTIPPSNNELLVEFLRARYPHVYAKRLVEIKEQREYQTAKQELERKIRREIWNANWNHFDEDPIPELQLQEPSWKDFMYDFLKYNPIVVQKLGILVMYCIPVLIIIKNIY